LDICDREEFLKGIENIIYFDRMELPLSNYMYCWRGGSFIDVGANVGMWVNYVQHQDVDIHAFEPSPRAFKTLQERFSDNPKFYAYEIALGDSEGMAFLKLHKWSANDGMIHTAGEYTGYNLAVPVRTLDSYHFKNVDIIKIDTEGYEDKVLYGSYDTIKRNEPRLIIEIHSPFDIQLQLMKDIMEDINYKYKLLYKKPLNKQPHMVADKRN
jgi:FkbM family methyltransferase